MFIKKNLYRDLLKRKKFVKEEKNLLLLKMLYKNEYLSDNLRRVSYNLYNKLSVKSTEIRNYCLLTGRSRSVLKKFRMSRISFREHLKMGLVVGVRKF